MMESNANQKKTLNDLLDEIFVVERDSNFDYHKNWPQDFPFGVYDEDSCLGLFPSECAAFQYRLSVINERLNTGWERFGGGSSE